MGHDQMALHLRQAPRPLVAFDPGPLLYRQEKVSSRMKPTIGRVVHYISHGTPVREDGTQVFPSKCRTAFVTEVPENPQDSDEAETVGLMVANPTGLFFQSLADGGCRYDTGKGGGTWHWPERETDQAPSVKDEA